MDTEGSLVTSTRIAYFTVLLTSLALSAGAHAKGGGGGQMGPGCDSPENKPETKQAIEQAKQMGCVCRSGFRTRAEQAAAYARHQGRPGAAAKPGNSRHEQGLAFDCPTVIQCPNGFKRLDNDSHKGMSHCSDTGG